MDEKPIIFNAEMVRAILDGRKTQTRRVIKPQPLGVINFCSVRDGRLRTYQDRPSGRHHVLEKPDNLKCPYGNLGDHLWVRESFWIEHDADVINGRVVDCGINLKEDSWADVWYCATDEPPKHPSFFHSKHPSIHMPRWASRITLQIESIRVEQVRVISRGDIKAEGVKPRNDAWPYPHRNDFIKLWNSINAKRGYSWESNPWVWVIEFGMVNDG